jgi:hypothetical protein
VRNPVWLTDGSVIDFTQPMRGSTTGVCVLNKFEIHILKMPCYHDAFCKESCFTVLKLNDDSEALKWLSSLEVRRRF